MIVDVHTHTPTHAQVVPEDERLPNPVFRPDRVVEAAFTWADYLSAMEPDKLIGFLSVQLIMDEIALAFPELRIVMAHVGHPWHTDTMALQAIVERDTLSWLGLQ
jgi:hypothetical protein